MTLLSLLGRIMRYFLLRPETLFLLCISLALWSYFFHTDEVKTIVKSSRDAVKMVKGKVAEMMQNERFGGLDVLDAEFSKTWEFKSSNVAVYSIQGRRDHMEDRFEMLSDIVNKSHPSIFGIFDGHGGEVSEEKYENEWEKIYGKSKKRGFRFAHVGEKLLHRMMYLFFMDVEDPHRDERGVWCYLFSEGERTSLNLSPVVRFVFLAARGQSGSD
ncbi:Protein phosphatase 1L [Dissostichus eleginoides]|nr:Protein phosphatase 1L [Dissostichus eleginoides]